jgi:hypothetical protein
VNNVEKVAALEALLARVQKNAAAPRPQRSAAPVAVAAAPAPAPAPSPVPAPVAARAPMRSEPAIAPAPAARPVVPSARPSSPVAAERKPATPAPAAAAPAAGQRAFGLGLTSRPRHAPPIPRDEPEAPAGPSAVATPSPAPVIAAPIVDVAPSPEPAPIVAKAPSDEDFLPIVEAPVAAAEPELSAQLPPPPPEEAPLAPLPVVQVAGDETPASIRQPAPTPVEPAPTPTAPEPSPIAAMIAAEADRAPVAEAPPSSPEPLAPPPFSATPADELPSKFAEAPVEAPKKKSNVALFVVVGLILVVAIVVYGYMRSRTGEGAAPTRGDAPAPTAEPAPTEAPEAKATAEVTAAPTAAPAEPTATASAEAAPTASAAAEPTPPKDPATLPATLGMLQVKTSLEGEVFVQGAKVGAVGAFLEVPCGSKFVSVGTDSPAGSKPVASKSVAIACQAVTVVELP